MLEQGKALVRAIEALATIKPSGATERAIASLLLRVYKRRLRGIVAVAPSWMSEEILSASQRIGKALATVPLIGPALMNQVGKSLILPGVAFASALLVLSIRCVVVPRFGVTVGTRLQRTPGKRGRCQLRGRRRTSGSWRGW